VNVDPPDATGFAGVVAGALLRGLTLACTSPITFLFDADIDSGAASGGLALRLLAGIGRPKSGRVRALGVDPANDAETRRSIALLGDDVLLDPTLPLEEAAAEVAIVRGIDRTKLPKGEDTFALRKMTSDVLAGPDRARLLLVSYPEHYEESARDGLLEIVNAALDRKARVVIATGSLDEVLGFAAGADASAALISRGAVVVAGPAHGLPWATPLDGVTTRVVRVVLAQPSTESGDPAVPPSARLAADLLSDATVAAHVAMIEPAGPLELRIAARDPRSLARAIASRAHDGLPVRHLSVQGATARTLAATWGANR